MGISKLNQKILHLVHEFPPDEIFGLGQSIINLIEESNNYLSNYIGCISMKSFRNFKGNSVYKNLIRTEPLIMDSIHREWLNQNDNLTKKIINKNIYYDVIHCHDWLLAPCAIKLSEYYNIPLVTTFYTIISERVRSGFIEMPKNLLESALKWQEKLVEKSKCCLTIDEDSKEILKKSSSNSNILSVNLGIKPEPLNTKVVKNGCFKVGYLGRLAKEKGIELIPQILKSIERVELHIAGTGGLKNELLKELSTLNINYRYYNYHDKIDFLKKIDLLLVPSHYDTGPLVAIEAVFAKVPVIMSSKCGFYKFFEGFEDYFISKPNVKSFKEKIHLHMTSENLIKSKLEKLYNRLMVSDLNIKNYSQKIISIYNEITKNC